jgi:hypothetical protein
MTINPRQSGSDPNAFAMDGPRLVDAPTKSLYETTTTPCSVALICISYQKLSCSEVSVVLNSHQPFK